MLPSKPTRRVGFVMSKEQKNTQRLCPEADKGESRSGASVDILEVRVTWGKVGATCESARAFAGGLPNAFQGPLPERPRSTLVRTEPQPTSAPASAPASAPGCQRSRWSDFRLERAHPAKDGAVTSEVMRFEHPMNRGVLSWNVATPGKSSVEVMLRARSETKGWSGWFTMGVWGERIASRSGKRQENGFGFVNVDTLMLHEGVRDWQYRIQLHPDKRGAMPTVHAVGLAVKNTRACRNGGTPASPEVRALDVPAISQFEAARRGRAPKLARRICSPTSVAMLLRYHGVTDPSPVRLAAKIYDRGARAYGNWPFNIAALFSALNAKLPQVSYLAYVRWYDTFDDLLENVRKDGPAIVNIAFKRGQLRGAPVPTSGHILLVRGADRNYVYVNDPAFPQARRVPARYARDEFVRAWKGAAYVVEKQVPPLETSQK
jgi:hypothetical protein